MAQVIDAASAATMPGWGRARWLLRRTIFNLRKSLSWAWLDTICQYRRSKIGPLWETINVLVMTFGMTVVSSAVIGGTVSDLIGYIGLGIIIWSAITALVVEGASTFVKNREYILASNLSIDYYVGRTMFRALITFGHHSALFFVGLAFGLVPLSAVSLLAVPGVLLLFVNGYWVVTLLALVCARFRDLELIVRNLLQLAFFVTPVFWDFRHVARDRTFIVDYNVLFYFLEIVRAPLLGEVPPRAHYLVVLAVTVVGYLLAYMAYRRMRRRLAFFV
jgi:ABC-2 type transport system permease protein/lipopolysaccharide transport system permease protein